MRHPARLHGRGKLAIPALANGASPDPERCLATFNNRLQFASRLSKLVGSVMTWAPESGESAARREPPLTRASHVAQLYRQPKGSRIAYQLCPSSPANL